MPSFEFDSPLDVDAVFARIDARAREWRESTLPADVRRHGVYGVTLRRDGSAFRLQFRGGDGKRLAPALAARVTPRPGGRSRVRGRLGLARSSAFATGALCAWVGAVAAFSGSRWFAFATALMFGGAWAVSYGLARWEREALVALVRDIAGLAPDEEPARSASAASAG